MNTWMAEAHYRKFDFQCVCRLVEILIQSGFNMTNHTWDLFESRINGLAIVDGKVCYYSFFAPSKRILNILSRYNQPIIENFKYITRGE